MNHNPLYQQDTDCKPLYPVYLLGCNQLSGYSDTWLIDRWFSKDGVGEIRDIVVTLLLRVATIQMLYAIKGSESGKIV